MKNNRILSIKKSRVYWLALFAVVVTYSCVPSKTLLEENSDVPDRY